MEFLVTLHYLENGELKEITRGFDNRSDAENWAVYANGEKVEIHDEDGNLVDEILPYAADKNPNTTPPN
jgi:hypothetical protein